MMYEKTRKKIKMNEQTNYKVVNLWLTSTELTMVSYRATNRPVNKVSRDIDYSYTPLGKFSQRKN